MFLFLVAREAEMNTSEKFFLKEGGIKERGGSVGKENKKGQGFSFFIPYPRTFSICSRIYFEILRIFVQYILLKGYKMIWSNFLFSRNYFEKLQIFVQIFCWKRI